MAEANSTVKAVLNHLLQNGGGAAKIVETSDNGSTFYRKYSDGFVIQGGTTATNDSQPTVTLPIEMRDTKYNVSLTLIDKTNDTDGAGNVDSVLNTYTTTTTFKVSHYHLMSGFYWKVCGYAA